MAILKLNKEISSSSVDVDPKDVKGVKGYLKELGYYKEPEWGITPYTDDDLFTGIRTLQKEKGLKVDGVMKPEGETEKKVK